jgi:hypothetical protein
LALEAATHDVRLYRINIADNFLFATAIGIFLGTVARSMPQLGLLYMLVYLPMNMLPASILRLKACHPGWRLAAVRGRGPHRRPVLRFGPSPVPLRGRSDHMKTEGRGKPKTGLRHSDAAPDS